MTNKQTNPPKTMPELLKYRAARAPHALAFMEKQTQNSWKGIQWDLFYEKIQDLAKGLVRAGVKPGDELAILMENSIQWEMIQHAGFMAGCTVVGLDPRDPMERLVKLMDMLHIQVLAVQTPDMLKPFSKTFLDSLSLILVSDGPAPPSPVSSMQWVSKIARPGQDMVILPRVEKNQAATWLFTSGTTGEPKAVSYDHDQLVAAVKAISQLFSKLPDQAHAVCWIPLASPFQRMVNWCGLLLNHKTFMVREPSGIMEEVRDISPHFMVAVPRFYEKIYQAVKTQKHPMDLMKAIFGNNLSFFISGSAPISLTLLKAFHGWGFPILESYGVSENIVPMTMNTMAHYQPGTTGRPLPQNTIKLAKDKEVLVKGIGVARKGVPLTKEGYLKTGDTGFIDEKGYLRLLGRKSDEFKLSIGRKISPAPIESRLRKIHGVDHALVHGAGQKFLVALLNITCDTWQELVKTHGSEQKARQFLQTEMYGVTRKLPSHCRPVNFFITHPPFSVATGELTGNLKLRRNHVLKTHAHRFNRIHQGD